MTRFAGKYALYLYREKDVDLIDQPTGVPVLFIPGHAGSYKQIRSIAAEAAFQYSHRYARHVENWDHGGRSLDFFTVDFNEEFSALHGQSLLEQAEYLNDAVDYILKLYPQSRKLDPRFSADLPDPTSVIIIGHSMGGVVARTMFTLPNYQPGTINTILTFSTPHLMPPAPFDWKITKIYSDISHYWMNGFKESDWTRSGMALKDVMLISVTGGVLDTMICPDNANVGGFIPQNNGFTVFTTAIPNVWTPTDHDSILSCNQLVKIIAKSLLDIVDARRGPQTRHLVERIGVMRRAFLSGLEDRNADLSLSPLSFYELPDSNVNFLKPQERLVIRADTATGMTFLPVFDNSGKNVFGVLTDMPIDATERFDLLLCNKLESHVVGYTRAGCRSARAIVAPIPASVSKEERQKSNSNFMFANIAFSEMAGYEYLAIVHKEGTNGFLIVEPHDIQETRQSIDKSMLALAIEGAQVDVKPFLFSTIHIPAIENPMLAYHLTISQPPCDNENMFATFLRQSISTMHESKFYLNLTNQGGKTSISIHGRTLFTSTPITGDVDRRGLMLQLWMDPTCPHPATISLSIDWYGSAGRVGFRNGIILAAFSFVIVILVLVAQIQCYNETGIFPHFGQGLMYCIQRSLPIATVLVSLCSIHQTTYSSSSLLETILPVPIAWNDLMTGNTDPFFWWLPAAGIVISLGIVCLLWILVELLLRIFTIRFTFFNIRLTFWRRWNNETSRQRLQRRTTTTIFLFILVATCIPYQFVFIVAFFVHIVSCVRSLNRAWANVSMKPPPSMQKRLNRYYYMQSILVLFITLLPFTLPILLVWIRNLSVHWFVPFSSDHSVLAIAPFILYVEMLTSHRTMLPRLPQR
ncbi:GPI inositol deacylase [Apophysomyces sp. BC1034]|nr:GPI inositol deacylase [Apophysomyces sp. BC1034]